MPLINYISNPVYLLTDDDSLDWVDKESLPGVCDLFARIVDDLDRSPRRDLARVSFPFRRLLMKLLRQVVTARTTCFGLKPVH